jgi:hypothetical protein
MKAEQKITETLARAGKPLKTVEIAALSELSKEAAATGLKQLQQQGKVYSPRRCYYSLCLKK